MGERTLTSQVVHKRFDGVVLLQHAKITRQCMHTVAFLVLEGPRQTQYSISSLFISELCLESLADCRIPE